MSPQDLQDGEFRCRLHDSVFPRGGRCFWCEQEEENSRAPPLYESMTRVPLSCWTVRVWREWSSLVLGPDKDVALAVIEASTHTPLPADEPQAIAGALNRIEGVSAYEITDLDGNGVVVYTVWP